jgi:Tol biopolymer transport system component
MSSDFAFSPDGRYLAFWACLELRAGCSVYIHDTHNQESTPITPLRNGATFFVWSPDNRYLAFVGAGPNLQYDSSLLVVDVQTGEVLDEGEFLWPELTLPPDSPVRDWGVKFPPLQGEFDACNQDR